MFHKYNWKLTACFAGTFMFLVVIMFLSPLSSDDYRLLAYNFIGIKEAFLFNLQYANGRLLGNFLGYIIVNSLFLKIIVKAFLITALIFMIPSVLKIKKSWAYYVSFVLLLAMDPEIFGQVYSWTAGFNNYVPPVFFICLIILLIERFADRIKTVFAHIVLVAVIIVLSVCSQLYLELNTLLNIALAIILVIVSKRSGERQQFNLYLTCFCSLTIGAIIMFILPKIFNASSPSYRGLQIGSVSIFIRSIASNGIKLFTFLENNTLLCCFLLLICGFLLVRKKDLFPKPAFVALFFSEVVSFTFILCDGLFRETMWLGHTIVIKQFAAALVGAIIFINLCVILIRVYGKKGVKLYILIGLGLLSLAPMLIVHPVPKRTFFVGYVIIVSLIISVMDDIYKEHHFDNYNHMITNKVVIATSLGTVLFFLAMFLGIHTLDVNRERHIVSEMNKHVDNIEIYRIPSKYVYWDEEWCFTYYYYYETPKDIQFEAIDYITWLGKYEDVSYDE